MQPAEEHIEGTVVITEADSAPCDPVGVVKEDEGEGSSCEAEARELSGSSDQSQDEDQTRGLEEKVVAMAEEMIQKWQLLKEVFRIPKRTPQVSRVCVCAHGGIIVNCSMATCTCVSINSCTCIYLCISQLKKASPDPSQGEESQDNSSEGAELDDENVLSRRNAHTRRGLEPELTWWVRGVDEILANEPRNNTIAFECILILCRSRKRNTLTPTQKRNSHSHKLHNSRSPHMTPTVTHTPPQSVTSSVYTGTTTTSYTNSSNTSYTGFTAAAPVQNTVIVQQPGQSVYVQQQVCGVL